MFPPKGGGKSGQSGWRPIRGLPSPHQVQAFHCNNLTWPLFNCANLPPNASGISCSMVKSGASSGKLRSNPDQKPPFGGKNTMNCGRCPVHPYRLWKLAGRHHRATRPLHCCATVFFAPSQHGEVIGMARKGCFHHIFRGTASSESMRRISVAAFRRERERPRDFPSPSLIPVRQPPRKIEQQSSC